MVQFKQPCDIIALLSFLCVCFSSFSPVGQTGFFFQSFMHLFSYPICLKQTSSFTKIIFSGFSPKIRRGKKIICSCLSLCRSRQILGCICRPIKGSQLTPHVEVRLTCFPSNIYVFLFKQISCLQSVVCEYIPLYCGLFFFTMYALSSLYFPALKMLQNWSVMLLYYLQSVLYLWQWLSSTSIHNFM